MVVVKWGATLQCIPREPHFRVAVEWSSACQQMQTCVQKLWYYHRICSPCEKWGEGGGRVNVFTLFDYGVKSDRA